MTTAVCKAADILGMKAELIDEFLAFVTLTNRLALENGSGSITGMDAAALMDSLIDEYDRKL